MTHSIRPQEAIVQTTTVSIDGMSCGGCVNSVTGTLKGLGGVTQVEVDLRSAKASLRHAATWAGEHTLIAALADAGYVARIDEALGNERPPGGNASAPRTPRCCCG